MREHICNLLAQHAGQTLTSAVGLEIVQALYPEQAIDPTQFEREFFDQYTIQAESFRSVLDELKPLHELHWLETEKYRHGLAMAPLYSAMAERERAGQMVQFTVREDGHLVGHLRMFIFQSQHTSTQVAEEDALFIAKEHRGGFLAIRLMRYAEAALLSQGVREIRANSKLSNRADVLMRRLGYDAVALQFVKLFDRPGVEPCT